MRIVWHLALVVVAALLLSACEESKETAAKKLLAMGYSVDGAGFVSLMQSEQKSSEMIDRFLKAGVHPLMQNEAGENALIIAVKSGDSENFKRFIQYVPEQSGESAPVNMKDATAKTALIYAVETGNREIAIALLQKGADVLQFDMEINTTLHHAILKNDMAMINLLLQHAEQLPGGKKQLVDFPNYRAQTPLYVAVEKQNTELVTLLINAGADANMATRRNATPLMIASEKGSVPIVAALIKQGAEINVMEISGDTPLTYSLKAGNDEITEMLLQEGADPGLYKEGGALPLQIVLEQEPFNKSLFSVMISRSNLDRKILHDLLRAAVISGRVEIVKLMIENGADVNHISEQGESLLYQALDKDQVEVALLLLDSGVDSSLTGASGIPPMEMALLRGNYKVISRLLDKGANPDVKTHEGYSLAEMAVYKGFPDILELLLSKGARLNMDFSLLWSIRDGGGKAVPVLLRYGANPNIMNQDGDSLLLLAASANQTEAVKAMIEYKADLNRGSRKLDMPPLSAAAYFGHIEPVKSLIEGGADINKRDSNGMTPVAYAAAHLKAEVVSYLVSKGADIGGRDNQGRSIDDMVAVAANSPDKQRILKTLAAARRAQ